MTESKKQSAAGMYLTGHNPHPFCAILATWVTGLINLIANFIFNPQG
jgi:hypothetical protein